MTWDAFTLGYLLNREGIITDQELELLQAKEGFNSGKYDSPANVFLREMLAQKGYDGIIYQNGFEGGWSVIAFYPDQIEVVQDIDETLAGLSEEQKSIYYAGKMGIDPQTVYDGEMGETEQALYELGRQDGGKREYTDITVHKGKGQYTNRSHSRSEMTAFWKRFAAGKVKRIIRTCFKKADLCRLCVKSLVHTSVWTAFCALIRQKSALFKIYDLKDKDICGDFCSSFLPIGWR